MGHQRTTLGLESCWVMDHSTYAYSTVSTKPIICIHMRVEPPSCGSAHLAATELWQYTLSLVDIASYPRYLAWDGNPNSAYYTMFHPSLTPTPTHAEPLD